MTSQEFTAAMAVVTRRWPAWKPLKGTFESWLPLLSDLSYESVLAAVDDLACEGREFAPPVGLIRKRAVELVEPHVPDVDEAWAEVQKGMSSYSQSWYDAAPGKQSFSHPAIAYVVEAMGWANLCLSQNQSTDRAHFIKLYEIATKREKRDAGRPESVRALLADTHRRALEGENLALTTGDES